MPRCRRAAVSAVMALAVVLVLTGCGRSDGVDHTALDAALRTPVIGLAVDPVDGSLVRAHARALFIRHDSSRKWSAIPLTGFPGDGHISTVTISRAAGRVMYVAGPGLGILKSADRGRSWEPVGDGLPGRDVTAFATHATRAATLYAMVDRHGLFRSEDGGTKWVRMEGGPGAGIRHLLHSDLAGSMQTGWLFAALPSEVRRSMDCFCGWRDTGALPDSAGLQAITYDPRRPEHVFVGTAAAVLGSTDGGRSWTLASRSKPVKVALAVDPVTRTLVGGSADGTIFRSRDEGRTWETVAMDSVLAAGAPTR